MSEELLRLFLDFKNKYYYNMFLRDNAPKKLIEMHCSNCGDVIFRPAYIYGTHPLCKWCADRILN